MAFRNQLRGREGRGQSRHLLIKQRQVDGASLTRRKTRVGQELGVAEQVEDARPRLVGIGHDADIAVGGRKGLPVGVNLRSEEHTSELQSLMRTSYAVFCLKKNTQCTYQVYK